MSSRSLRRLLAVGLLVIGWSDAASADESRARPNPDQQPERGWFCVPPASRAYSHCHKGSAASEESLARCKREEAAQPPRPARFKVGKGPSVEFSPKGYRCVPVPLSTRYRVAVEHFASWEESLGEECKSRVKDLVEPNFYGALTTRCSRRNTGADERLSDYTISGSPAASEK